MAEIGLVSSEPRKFLFLIIVNSRRFGSCPRTPLSMNKVFVPAEKVSLEFDPRQIVSSKTAFSQTGVMRY
jgi:hypothetical protein